MLIVQKYGGSSIADVNLIKKVASKVVDRKKRGNRMVIVVSAMGDTTDHLINTMNQITNHPPEREVDMLLSTGEQVSTALLAMAIKELGEESVSFTGLQAGIQTDSVHTKAKITQIDTGRLMAEIDMGKIPVVAGFQGYNSLKDITTLGRGGSDTTAVALAVALKADLCEIFTDVDGIFTADPRLVPEARKLDTVSFDEMLELSNLGAGVLHPRSVELAKIYNIPMKVRCSFNDNEGTLIQEASVMEKDMVVTGVAHDKNVVKVGLYDVPDRPGVAKAIFELLARDSINVDMIIQSANRNSVNDISFTVSRNDLDKTIKVVEEIKDSLGISGFSYDETVAKVSIIGAGMTNSVGVAAKMFSILAGENINLEMISTSEIKISCVIKEVDTEKAVRALHKSFNLG